jgi:hypothetical protein
MEGRIEKKKKKQGGSPLAYNARESFIDAMKKLERAIGEERDFPRVESALKIWKFPGGA